MGIMCNKMTAIEAMEYVHGHGLNWYTESREVARECNYCGAYVTVCEYANECEVNGEKYEGICDDCRETAEYGEKFEEFDSMEESDEFQEMLEKYYGEEWENYE